MEKRERRRKCTTAEEGGESSGARAQSGREKVQRSRAGNKGAAMDITARRGLPANRTGPATQLPAINRDPHHAGVLAGLINILACSSRQAQPLNLGFTYPRPVGIKFRCW